MALRNYKKLLEIKVNFRNLFDKSNLSPTSIANLLGFTSRRTVDDLKFREYGGGLTGVISQDVIFTRH